MNNLDEQQIMEIENDYWVDMASSLERLNQNPDFQKVILQGYFTDKAVNGVSMLAQDSVVNSGNRPAVMEDLIGVSSLQDHFITIRNLGTVSIDDDEDNAE
jgi:hypothetical protein